MGRVALFRRFSVLFKSLFARGPATLQNEILTVMRFGHSLSNFIGYIL